MDKKIETKELVKFMNRDYDILFAREIELSEEIIERLKLHDVYKEGIENLLRRMREWIEEASR